MQCLAMDELPQKAYWLLENGASLNTAVVRLLQPLHHCFQPFESAVIHVGDETSL